MPRCAGPADGRRAEPGLAVDQQFTDTHPAAPLLARWYAAGLARADRSWPVQVQARLSEVDEVSILPLVERLTPDGSGLTGTAASSEIARRANRTFPTLVVTGDTAKERIVEIQASGFVMMHKPVEASDLRRALAELVEENVRALSANVP